MTTSKADQLEPRSGNPIDPAERVELDARARVALVRLKAFRGEREAGKAARNARNIFVPPGEGGTARQHRSYPIPVERGPRSRVIRPRL